MTSPEIESLKAQIAALEKEVRSLKQTSIFSDIQPYIPEHATKYIHIKINPIGLTYLVNFKKSSILTLLRDRIAEDLHQDDVENIQLLDPIKGTLLNLEKEKEIDLKGFEDEDHVIVLDFQYKQQFCDHEHDHDHSHGDLDSEDDFTDDENFYSQCSCSQQH